MISVIIATKNRPADILLCLTSLLHTSCRDFEIIVADQSTDPRTRRTVMSLHHKKITYIRHPQGGKSQALNAAVARSKGDILAFTDDDCIVPRSWLSRIIHFFRTHPEADGLLGSTYPYKPERHPDEHCPSVYTHMRSRIITRVAYHATKIGFGNNMAIRHDTFIKEGGFKSWLGPGTVGQASEDAELELRLLLRGRRLGYDAAVRIYHNKWLTKREDRRQNLRYVVGEHACYGYYLFLGHAFPKTIIRRALKRTAGRLRRYIVKLFGPGTARKRIGTLWWELQIYIHQIYGLCIGWHFAGKDPFRS